MQELTMEEVEVVSGGLGPLLGLGLTFVVSVAAGVAANYITKTYFQ